MRNFLSLCALCLVAPLARGQTLVRAVNGPAANAMYGKACLVVSDQNADGYKDLVVGSPGYNSQRGAVYCLSGAYIAFGTGTQTLWSVTPAANPGDLFGYAIANVGDNTGDGVDDFLVGQPGYDISGSNDVGAVRLVSGASHLAVSLIHGVVTGYAFGTAIAACGNADGFGGFEVGVGAPGPLSTDNRFYVLQGGSHDFTGSLSTLPTDSFVASGTEIGASIAGGFDLDGDGHPEFVVGAPGDSGGGSQAGAVVVLEVSSLDQLSLVAVYTSAIAGERFGTSVDAAHDYDGDGVVDIVVGAPNSPHGTGSQVGRAVVLSGARLVAQTPPYEIYDLYAGAYGSPFLFSFHYGAAVRASGDLNNDGVGDILVGAPDYYATFAQPGKGYVTVYSGATGTQLCGYLVGATQDRLGGNFAGAIDDLDGDGFKEFVVAGPLSDAGGTDSGVLKCYRLFPVAPGTYCTPKVNSLGCSPSINFSGTADVNSSTPFLIGCTNQINQKAGIVFYSHEPISAAFQGGFLCVKAPHKRTPLQNSGGSATGSDCTGTFSFDFNARIQSGVDPTLVAGAEIYCQYWSRDGQSASSTSLSNALRFLIQP